MFSTANYIAPVQYKYDYYEMCLCTPLPETRPGIQEAASTPSVNNLRSLALKILQE
jgi:hypothetical protein